MKKKTQKNTKSKDFSKPFYKSLELEMTDQEKENLEKVAMLNGITVSQFISDALSGFIIEKQRKELKKLKAIGKKILTDYLDELCRKDIK